MSLYTRYGLPYVKLSLSAFPEQQPGGFLEAHRGLIGCRPELTPTRDDSFVGFLAAHYLCGSILVKEVRRQKLDAYAVILAGEQTTPVSTEMVAYAVKGRFSETLYQLWNDLPVMTNDFDQNGPVQRLLIWGSTSGTDTIVGMIMGLATWTASPPSDN